MPKENIFAVTLQRYDRNTPWGVSIVGGSDVGSPILVTRALQGSPCDGKLMIGDEIKKIGDYDARDISHQDVLNLFCNADTSIKLYVKRDPRTKAVRLLSGADVLAQSSTGTLSSVPASPVTPKIVTFPPSFSSLRKTGDIFYKSLYGDMKDEEETVHVMNQPYRTTPLVLPGAKAKHEAPTGTYLRHHPNPNVRSGPYHYEGLPHDVAMKQKVADSILQRIEQDERDALAGKQIVHRQFNTPIGLYSHKNIEDTIQHSTGFNTGLSRSPSFGRNNPGIAPKKTFDPTKSEALRALHEEQYGDGPAHEVTIPVQTKVFTPNKQPPPRPYQPAQGHTYNPSSRSSAQPNVQHNVPYVNPMGHSDSQIIQSGSFKRLMSMVLPDSN